MTIPMGFIPDRPFLKKMQVAIGESAHGGVIGIIFHTDAKTNIQPHTSFEFLINAEQGQRIIKELHLALRRLEEQ